MYTGFTVMRLLHKQNKSQTELLRYLFGDKRRNLKSLVEETANPTAKTLERMADFFQVSIDDFFAREGLVHETLSEKDQMYVEKLLNRQQEYIQALETNNLMDRQYIQTLESYLAQTQARVRYLERKYGEPVTNFRAKPEGVERFPFIVEKPKEEGREDEDSHNNA